MHVAGTMMTFMAEDEVENLSPPPNEKKHQAPQHSFFSSCGSSTHSEEVEES